MASLLAEARFNSNLVQLKAAGTDCFATNSQSFNSNLVQLKAAFPANVRSGFFSFNSNLVQLKGCTGWH